MRTANVYRNDHLQALECRHCEALIEVPRRLLRDPEGYSDFVRAAELTHKKCGEFDDPHKAKLSREFDRKVAEELKRIEEASRGN